VIQSPRTLRGRAASRARGRADGFVRTALVSAVIIAVSAGQARGSDAALAQTLFNEGRALMSAKQLPEACAKFAESQRLDPATGTLLNLAACHEAEGKLATAWAEYLRAQAAARRSNRSDRVQFAGEHIAALEKRLSYLTVHVPAGARTPGLEVALDGTELGPAAWEVAAPIDPGRHRVTATVSGRSVFGRDVTFAQPGQRQVVDVAFTAASPSPKLATEPAHPVPVLVGPSAPAAAESPAWWDGRGTALAIGGAGVALAAVGTVFGLRAYSEWKDRDKQCSDPTRACTPGLTSAWIANITLPLGAIGLGAASYRLWRDSW
jgi:tetratricopeptide (TPR) repeat protein